jgi:hypothetical protein
MFFPLVLFTIACAWLAYIALHKTFPKNRG